jgi:hypothetical protein
MTNLSFLIQNLPHSVQHRLVVMYRFYSDGIGKMLKGSRDEYLILGSLVREGRVLGEFGNLRFTRPRTSCHADAYT